MASNFSKLAGNIGADFQIDKTGVGTLGVSSGAGPTLAHINSTLVVAADLSGPTFAEVLAQHVTTTGGTNDNVLTTFGMFKGRFVIAASFDSSLADPTNTGSLRFLVCATGAGVGTYNVGDIAFDNGTSIGACIRIQVQNGFLITIGSTPTTAGTLPVLAANSAYLWSGSAYQKLTTSASGNTQVIRVPFVTADFPGILNSTATIPGNATILRSRVRVKNGATFDVGTVSAGYTGQVSRLMASADSNLATEGNFTVEGTTGNLDWSATNAAVLLTLTGAPAAGGSGEFIVEFVVPEA